MRITHFEHTGLERIITWAKRNNIQEMPERDLKEVLKTINISFVAEGINRVQSMLLCELKASYVQQSQRYVAMGDDAYVFPDLPPNESRRAVELGQRAMELYAKMGALKNGSFKGRPKPEHYLYGIPIEDARYILPLGAKTNLAFAMTGDKLTELYRLLSDYRYGDVFCEFKQELSACLPGELLRVMPQNVDGKNSEIIEDFYREDLAKITPVEDVVLLTSCQDPNTKAGLGALTSTQSKSSSEILKAWGDEADKKARETVQRVMGYGHESIAEQARTTFGIMCSFVTYHQQVRHRLPEMYREDLLHVLLDLERPVVIPDSIRQSPFYNDYVTLTDDFRKFAKDICLQHGLDKALPFILNCQLIKIVMSTNARIDNAMLSERTCLNAQWEIRQLAVKKLKILRGLSDVLYEKALPPCLISKCKEGKMACGRVQEVRKMFLG
ncbi:FAD-dependent thymidylate synthase [Dehalobacter sp. DCM]|uniref:FAD-dependent thymidylate synthase n=1 Tax=Dehalobacter sp. DCM TaxID=2907827 RepID=UPI00308146EA|nr:FAD-dependent thymidylate synthase [Dehalobacter sp. DCM]